MEDSAEASGRKHGRNSMAIACRHVVWSVEAENGRPVGFHSEPSDRRRFPYAWCTACDRALAEAGAWTPKVVKRMRLRFLCPCCYEFARAMNDPASRYESVRWR